MDGSVAREDAGGVVQIFFSELQLALAEVGLAALEPDALFVWGRQDRLVPIAFARHVSETAPGARHLELNCGHVPQLERPRETHAALIDFLGTR